MNTSYTRPVGVLVISAALTGCFATHGRAIPSDAGIVLRLAEVHAATVSPSVESARPTDRPQYADPDAGRASPAPIWCAEALGVDLLIVLDDSGSLRPDDTLVRDRMERMLLRLLRPLDLDEDGTEDWARVTDLHVGVVSTSVLGASSCERADDGRLRRGPGATFGTCDQPTYPAYQIYQAGDDPQRIVRDVACVAFGPRVGCQLEQPLEAMTKALLPSDAPFEYVAGTARGDTDNIGFLREDTLLAVLILTDEDDCSASDPAAIEDPSTPSAEAGARGCQPRTNEPLHPTARYLEVLEFLRGDHPERLLFAFVGGIEPAFTEVFDADLGGCRAALYPARLIDVARGLPGRTVAGSFCSLGEMDFVQAMAARIANAACNG